MVETSPIRFNTQLSLSPDKPDAPIALKALIRDAAGTPECELAKYSDGLFTYCLPPGLKRQEDAPLDRIYPWVTARVTREAAADGWKQHPVFGSSGEVSPAAPGIAPFETIGWLPSAVRLAAR
jgi:hypothetical protein